MSIAAELEDALKPAHFRSRYGFALSPQFARAKAAREPKPVTVASNPPPAPAPQRPSSDEPESIVVVLDPIAELAEITDYTSLLAALRARADELEISRELLSELAGFPDRYASKLLSLKQVKRIGMTSLGSLLSALSLKLVAIVDDEALERNRERYIPRDQAHTTSAKARWQRPAGLADPTQPEKV
jgi:hypothetical protein